MALVGVCGALAAAAVQREEDRCTDAVTEMFFALDDRASGSQLDATTAGIESRCDGSTRLIDAAGVLFERDEPERAAGLLREAVDREPDNFNGWASLASVLAASDPAGARRAADRARALNSQYRPPA